MKEQNLPNSFIENLEQIAEGLNGKPINTDFSAEWKLSAANVILLLEYMYKSGLIEIVWRPERQEFCFVKVQNNRSPLRLHNCAEEAQRR